MNNMVEKRGRGRPKKSTQNKNSAMPEITMDDIKKEVEKIVDERLKEENIYVTMDNNASSNDVKSDVDSECSFDDEFSSDVPTLWQGFFNILSIIYERNGDMNNCVKYNKKKNCLMLFLDADVYSSSEKEIEKIKTVSSFYHLKYDGKIEDNKLVIAIYM